jgi:hypothetical protein
MVHYQEYVTGWLDSSIHDVLASFPLRSKSMKDALLTCIDSNFDLLSLLDRSPELKSLASQAVPFGKGIVVPTPLLLKIDARSQLFFGFDEIWFFPQKPMQPKPDTASLIGPSRIDQAKLDELGGWMSENSCSLALGDGEGLNFIVKARGLAKYLLAHSLEQPQPTVTPFETADSA